MTLKNYVISLTTATDRRQHITNEFGKQGIEFEFFDAITPNLVEKLCQELNIDLIDNPNLSPTEKACFLSHIAVMQKALDDNLPYVSIFEDDIYLGENAHLYYSSDSYLKENDICILKPEVTLYHRKLNKQSAIKLPDNRIAYHLNEYHLGMGSYIISNHAIQQFLSYIRQLSKSNLIPIDNLLFDVFINKIPIYQLSPAICIQECIKHPKNTQLISSLEQERLHRKKNKPKRTFLQKLKGELSNAFRKTFGRLIRKKIEFR